IQSRKGAFHQVGGCGGVVAVAGGVLYQSGGIQGGAVGCSGLGAGKARAEGQPTLLAGEGGRAGVVKGDGGVVVADDPADRVGGADGVPAAAGEGEGKGFI
ncbi:MAG: hypothetical protein ACK56I_25735, partial [bacterium]